MPELHYKSLIDIYPIVTVVSNSFISKICESFHQTNDVHVWKSREHFAMYSMSDTGGRMPPVSLMRMSHESMSF